MHKDQRKEARQALDLMITSLTTLRESVDKGESIVSIEISKVSDVQGGASPEMTTWEHLPTGHYQTEYRMEIINLPEAETFHRKSQQWTTYTNTPSMMSPPPASSGE